MAEQVIDVFEADLHAPSGEGRRGTVVLLHGGFWRQRYDRVHLYPLAEALAETGYRVAVPEYRRVGGSGGYPETFDDVTAALIVARGLAGDEPGEPGLAVVGHSAGGQLAVWSQGAAAVAAGAPRARRVVSLAGVLDLAEAHRLGLSGGAVGALLGADQPGFGARLERSDPMAAPPSDELSSATVLLHGSDDGEVPPGFSSRYAATHPGTGLHLFEGMGHYELIDPLGAAWPSLLAALQ